VIVQAPNSAFSHISELAICVALYLLIAHGVQTFRSLHVVAGVVLAMVLLVCGVGVDQGFAPKGCVVIDDSNSISAGIADGRPCEIVHDCYLGDSEPGAEYACEHIGLFGTTSIGGGRIRYRGVLQDPNELALAGAVGLPLAFAFGQVRRTNGGRRIAWRVLPLLTLLLVLVCVALTASRGGQLVLVVVLATYFLKRFGALGAVFSGALAAPLLLLAGLGGRSGAEASSSTLERLDAWSEALSIWRSHPVLGAGLGQFGEYHYLTAHNSYLLALAELGLPGMMLLSSILYLSAKIPLAVLREPAFAKGGVGAAGASIAHPWAMALLAAFAGLAVGIFFLSFTYHYVLWIYIGLSGALYSAVRKHLPTFKVKFQLSDFALVAIGNVTIITGIYFYTRWVLT